MKEKLIDYLKDGCEITDAMRGDGLSSSVCASEAFHRDIGKSRPTIDDLKEAYNEVMKRVCEMIQANREETSPEFNGEGHND